jgi:hypothetical protein
VSTVSRSPAFNGGSMIHFVKAPSVAR